ncbi:MAG: lysophospholipid acyltransferase family protein [Myxococcota bacterium]
MKERLAAAFLRLSGWAPEGAVPTAKHYVLIAAPHTSNWDLVYLLALSWVLGVRVSWMGKHTLFRGPAGTVMRGLGGVPVRRDRRNDLVAQMVQAFADSPTLALVVPAEGTRSAASHWKSGFYRIARAAEVPVVLGYLDYGRRRGGFGPEIRPSGDVKRDMDRIRAFYADKTPRHPEGFGPVQLVDEEKQSRS